MNQGSIIRRNLMKCLLSHLNELVYIHKRCSYHLVRYRFKWTNMSYLTWIRENTSSPVHRFSKSSHEICVCLELVLVESKQEVLPHGHWSKEKWRIYLRKRRQNSIGDPKYVPPLSQNTRRDGSIKGWNS